MANFSRNNNWNNNAPVQNQNVNFPQNQGQNQPARFVYEVSGERVELTPEIVYNELSRGNKGVSDPEIFLFMRKCQFMHLNPFVGDAFLVKYDETKPAQMITSVAAMEKRADSNPNFDGMEAGIIVRTPDGEDHEIPGQLIPSGCELVGGWAKVYRKDRAHPTYAAVGLKEMSKNQSTWKTMQALMIRKCAKAQALREAFPNLLADVYTDDEMGEIPVETPEPVQTKSSRSWDQTPQNNPAPMPNPAPKLDEPVDGIVDDDNMFA